MSRAQDKEKHPSPRQELNLDLPHTDGWMLQPLSYEGLVASYPMYKPASCMTCDLHTARISNANKHHVCDNKE